MGWAGLLLVLLAAPLSALNGMDQILHPHNHLRDLVKHVKLVPHPQLPPHSVHLLQTLDQLRSDLMGLEEADDELEIVCKHKGFIVPAVVAIQKITLSSTGSATAGTFTFQVQVVPPVGAVTLLSKLPEFQWRLTEIEWFPEPFQISVTYSPSTHKIEMFVDKMQLKSYRLDSGSLNLSPDAAKISQTNSVLSVFSIPDLSVKLTRDQHTEPVLEIQMARFGYFSSNAALSLMMVGPNGHQPITLILSPSKFEVHSDRPLIGRIKLSVAKVMGWVTFSIQTVKLQKSTTTPPAEVSGTGLTLRPAAVMVKYLFREALSRLEATRLDQFKAAISYPHTYGADNIAFAPEIFKTLAGMIWMCDLLQFPDSLAESIGNAVVSFQRPELFPPSATTTTFGTNIQFSILPTINDLDSEPFLQEVIALHKTLKINKLGKKPAVEETKSLVGMPLAPEPDAEMDAMIEFHSPPRRPSSHPTHPQTDPSLSVGTDGYKFKVSLISHTNQFTPTDSKLELPRINMGFGDNGMIVYVARDSRFSLRLPASQTQSLHTSELKIVRQAAPALTTISMPKKLSWTTEPPTPATTTHVWIATTGRTTDSNPIRSSPLIFEVRDASGYHLVSKSDAMMVHAFVQWELFRYAIEFNNDANWLDVKTDATTRVVTAKVRFPSSTVFVDSAVKSMQSPGLDLSNFNAFISAYEERKIKPFTDFTGLYHASPAVMGALVTHTMGELPSTEAIIGCVSPAEPFAIVPCQAQNIDVSALLKAFSIQLSDFTLAISKIGTKITINYPAPSHAAPAAAAASTKPVLEATLEGLKLSITKLSAFHATLESPQLGVQLLKIPAQPLNIKATYNGKDITVDIPTIEIAITRSATQQTVTVSKFNGKLQYGSFVIDFKQVGLTFTQMGAVTTLTIARGSEISVQSLEASQDIGVLVFSINMKDATITWADNSVEVDMCALLDKHKLAGGGPAKPSHVDPAAGPQQPTPGGGGGGSVWSILKATKDVAIAAGTKIGLGTARRTEMSVVFQKKLKFTPAMAVENCMEENPISDVEKTQLTATVEWLGVVTKYVPKDPVAYYYCFALSKIHGMFGKSG